MTLQTSSAAMYDASKYSDARPAPALSAEPPQCRRDVGQSLMSDGRPRRQRDRPLPVSTSTPTCLIVDAAPPPPCPAKCLVLCNGGRTGGSTGTVSGQSSIGSAAFAGSTHRDRHADRRRCACGGLLFDVSATLTASPDDGTVTSPADSVASTVSSPGDVQPAAGGDLLRPGSGRCRPVSLADEYFPVTLGGRRSTDPGQVPDHVTSNGRHHRRRRHSHHRRHRQHSGQGHGHGHGHFQGQGRPSSGHSSSSSNSRSSVSHIYAGVGTANGVVTNGR